MILEKNWRFKSIEGLEKKDFGPIPNDASSIVTRALKLSRVPINEFQVDDIRFMIVQGIGLKYLIVEAIQLLKENLLTEGNYYEGDLLNALFLLDKEQWRPFKAQWDEVDILIKDQVENLRSIRPKLKVDNFYECRPV